LIRLLAPAKVNLNLRVLGVRPDGYHEIESLVQKISLYDRITLTKEDQPRIRVVCATPGIPTGPENLVYRAAALLMEAPGFKGKGVTILLEKHIPQGAGLGGGSSDAAAVLLGLSDLFGLPIGMDHLEDIAARVGSDVPLFLHPSPSWVTGRGEIVRQARLLLDAFFVLVFPGFEISTRWAYSNFRLTKNACKYRISTLKKVERGELAPDHWQDLLVNDLEAAVLKRHPEIGRCKRDLVRLGARASLMSGSGSAVFGLFDDQPTARRAVEAIVAEGWHSALIAEPLFS
jgi:4-diphosphocytidyl-2-C-methyl-D-erythritol kinase